MNKPISIVINETRISLAEILNKSGLPACILEPIVRDLHEEIKQVSAMQLKQDTDIYNKAQEEEKTKSKEQKQETK